MHFQPFAVGLEPLPDVSVFVVGSVVLNQDCSLVVVSASQLFEETGLQSPRIDNAAATPRPWSAALAAGSPTHRWYVPGNSAPPLASASPPGRHHLSRLLC